MKLCWTILCVLTLYRTVSGEERLLIDKLRWDFLQLENNLWNLSQNGWLNQKQEDAELYLAKNFFSFDQELQKMPQDLLYGVSPLRTIPDFLFLYSELKVINIKYKKLREYLKMQLDGAKTNVAIEDITYDILNNDTGIEPVIKRVYDLAYDQTDSMKQELYRLINENYWCKNLAQSPQQLFYNLYNLMALTELKAYVLQQFAYLGNLIWDQGNNDALSFKARKNYQQKSTQIINGLAVALKSPQDIWKCDPKIFVKGTNYDEFTRLLQGHIQNEVDMSSARTCKATCGEYQYTKSYGCYDYKNDICTKVERCGGVIIGCFFVESDGSICASIKPSRRYDFVRYDSGKTLGKGGDCPNHRTIDSWTRWFVRCHYCMCLCDQQGPSSDRYINQRPVMADVKNNRVVTGLKLIKHNRILHLQIQEGKLLPYGYIDAQTVHWVKLDNYKITDSGVEDKKDFFTMSYGDRSMAMDEIQVNKDNHVLTGVRFEHIDKKIRFQIYVSPFDWHTGEVNDKEGHYIYETSPHGSRTKYDYKKPDVPTETPSPSQMHHSGSRKYVEFTHTDFDKDVAQTTIPFIDIQEVVNQPAVPLMGAGIYYKGNEGYGGFIAPRIRTYNYAKHVSSKMPELPDREVPYTENGVEIN